MFTVFSLTEQLYSKNSALEQQDYLYMHNKVIGTTVFALPWYTLKA